MNLRIVIPREQQQEKGIDNAARSQVLRLMRISIMNDVRPFLQSWRED
jgi:hypothetical protein